MTDEEIIEVLESAERGMSGGASTAKELVRLSSIRSAGWDVVRKDDIAGLVSAAREAGAEDAAMYRSARADALAEAADVVIGCDDEPWIGKDAQRRERNAMEGLRAALSAFKSGKADGWRHRKTGGVYRIIGKATREHDLVEQVVYQSVKDGRVWSRPESEFYDGRFEKLPSPPASKSEAGDE